MRVCLRDLGLGLASIIPRSCRLCDGNAERLRLDELLGFEARREVEVGSEPALLPRDCDVERKSDQKSGLKKRETYMLATGPCLCVALWWRADQGLCSFHFDRVL